MERQRVNVVQITGLAGVVGAALLALASVRVAMQALSLVLIVLAAARAFLPRDRALAVRSRGFDAVLLAALGVALGYLSFSPDL
ncbi:DUF3017 domain-containing protein [Litorihabitans aurantiacus]|uniref:DUF3017 domain-containing protein n=1 Tax=Litorihabitans aurantiacus TaxID=1930061 RepID=A0AA37XFU8_9MICO|nr:DUF3017 domain-containing protein [Litorihabitans aurantiacus]GMA32196.1 hypothetical protein GCM10025875_21880 [Litorihabitans aurantiacus]